ncbi:MAG: DUF1456 family protein [Alkalibacterium gilvum]|uniref:Uncharacterized conserved protein YehS, DUF1456 family n=1 Tax=Alkalibacterium gilvum TaxID=1130080 RepID=A0A1H6RXK8_9LACT|nr:DUF1456 family protein [Alkalibacterium gilvum]MDN6729281.1 DUF1456 family protein [Alkalibacterium sp.]SEI60493.1 Uncharacterized conserved protein YehS, DUF1456 family [Alkalibacterium gilvum]
MNNNDRLVRLRYALDIKDSEMTEIFKLGESNLSIGDVRYLLSRESENEVEDDEFTENHYKKECSNRLFESFLNGLIVYKRGRQMTKTGEPVKMTHALKHDKDVNNILLKKVKVALKLTNEDMLDILEEADVYISKGELSAVLRKEDHRNYQECGERYARNFLKGLVIEYRG